MKLNFHPDINVLYLELREGEEAQTLEIDLNTYLDLDGENRVLGIEILNAREFLAELEKRGGTLSVPDVVADPANFKPESVFVP